MPAKEIEGFSDENIRAVAQYVIEDMYSRKNIGIEIQKDISMYQTEETQRMFLECQKLIDTWIFTASSYPAKQKRKDTLLKMDLQTLVEELFIAVLSNGKQVPIQSVADQIARNLPFDELFDGVTAAGEILAICVDVGLYDIILPAPNSQRSAEVLPLVQLRPETLEFIERTRYLNPMIVEPVSWEQNRHGGYFSTRDSVLLGKQNHHEEYQALDALNIAQSVAWELNLDILDLPELPNSPPESLQAEEAHKLLAETSQHVYDELLEQGNEFHFVNRYDFRGRMYTQGYYVNLQSTNYKKALLDFATYQEVTGF